MTLQNNLSMHSKTTDVNVKNVSNPSYENVADFKEMPLQQTKEEGNISDGLNAFDLFQAYTSNIIHKNIVYGR